LAGEVAEGLGGGGGGPEAGFGEGGHDVSEGGGLGGCGRGDRGGWFSRFEWGGLSCPTTTTAIQTVIDMPRCFLYLRNTTV